MGARHENWKFVFCEQRVEGTLLIWSEPFVCGRLFKLFNLRMDPYERADITSNSYYDWFLGKAYMVAASQILAGRMIATFTEFPPRMKAPSVSVDQAMEKMDAGLASN